MPKDEVIINEGEIGTKVYVLVTGEVLAYREDRDGAEIRLRTINDASDFTYFGEVGRRTAVA